MPKMYMMIGVPGSGKSTWIAQNQNHSALVASSDAYIDRKADDVGKTYKDVFADNIKAANRYAQQVAKQAFDLNLDLVWDQTNINKKSRSPKLAIVPRHYEKIAVFFSTPEPNEHQKRLNSRAGKQIPDHVMQSMINSLELPSADEGFDKIIVVN